MRLVRLRPVHLGPRVICVSLVRPITVGKCVCDGYIASTKVRPVTRTCDTGRAQDRQPGTVAGGERGGSHRPRPQGLKPPDLSMRQTLPKEGGLGRC